MYHNYSNNQNNGSDSSSNSSFVKLDVNTSDFYSETMTKVTTPLNHSTNEVKTDFSFLPSSHSDADVSGAMENLKGLPKKNLNMPGSGFLQQKGFGWLFEVDQSEEESQQSLLEELDIDLSDIVYKLRCILCPFHFFAYNRKRVLNSPDFWGPLIVVLLFCTVSLYGQMQVVSWIITLWIFGSIVIFLLARVLGGEVSYSQCLGVIGYSVLPLVICSACTALVSHSYLSGLAVLLRLLGVIWATYSAGSLLCVQELQNKRPLLLYPIFLLYVYFFSLHSGA